MTSLRTRPIWPAILALAVAAFAGQTSAADKPPPAQPAATQPATTQPATTQPASAKTPAAQPSTAQPSTGQSPAIAKKPASKAPANLVDINSAPKKELKALPGIGDAEAERIIAGRPYNSKADLATRDVIPTGVYVSIKNSIIAKQPAKPNTKK